MIRANGEREELSVGSIIEFHFYDQYSNLALMTISNTGKTMEEKTEYSNGVLIASVSSNGYYAIIDKSQKAENSNIEITPKTGDDSALLFWFTVGIVSLGVCLFICKKAEDNIKYSDLK